MHNAIRIETLLDLSQTIAADLFRDLTYPWEALPKLKDFIRKLGTTLPANEYEQRAEDIWIAHSAVVAPTASLAGPLIICAGAEIRHCAFIRGSAIIGQDAVVGNSTEVKNSLLFNNVQVPHYNYVGDSILGFKAHMGAGSITSNVKSDKTLVYVPFGGEHIETGLRKFGAVLGDFVEVGCNSVLNPGAVVGRNSSVYPLSSVRGVVPENSIYKARSEIVHRL
ncbi:MAG: UDP-N-acetylglucosamine pyrophosphorylase [Ruminococcaceae bacterium]|nr:UDP-N-acetylglucosamine pyrophosphorylase [Oscillospiraceae bacterium]